jgi:ABC-type polar amino acid transport system ATPase subunit
MDHGRIVEQGPPRHVLSNPQQPRTREFLKHIQER